MNKTNRFGRTTASQTNKDAHGETQKEDTSLLRCPCSTSMCAWGSVRRCQGVERERSVSPPPLQLLEQIAHVTGEPVK